MTFSAAEEAAIVRLVRPLIDEAARATGQQTAARFRVPALRLATAETVDAKEGTAVVVIDGDPADTTVEVRLACPAPPPGTRVYVLFQPPAGAYLIGQVGPYRGRLPQTGDVTLGSETHAWQIGDDDDTNLAFDSDEVQARDNGAAAALDLNRAGGTVVINGTVALGVPTGSYAAFGNTTVYGSSGYGVAQTFAGNTHVNAPDGQTVQVRNDGSYVAMTVGRDGSGVDWRLPNDIPTATGGGYTQLIVEGDRIRRTSSRLADKVIVAELDPAEARRLVADLVAHRYHRHADTEHRAELGFIADWLPEVCMMRDARGPIDVDLRAIVAALAVTVRDLLQTMTGQEPDGV